MPAVAKLFPTVAKVKTSPIDPEFLTVEHGTPVPRLRTGPEGKYHNHFKLLRPGSCVRCEPKEINTLANALRKALSVGRYPALAGCKAAAMKCPDGHGRVWALKEEA